MAKVLATEIRAGNLLEWDKRVWRVLKSYHVHVGGRGGAFMQVEMKDIEAGTKTNTRFRTDDMTNVLGQTDAVSSVRITWPDRKREEFGPMAAGAYHTLREGEGKPATQ